jgi:hypothetical protein
MSEKSERAARPWDLFNKNIGRVAESLAKERMALCLECPSLIKATKQCKKCGCFMEAKTKLPNASCPIGKWDAVDINLNNVDYLDEDFRI